jgi:hypothetical protein
VHSDMHPWVDAHAVTSILAINDSSLPSETRSPAHLSSKRPQTTIAIVDIVAVARRPARLPVNMLSAKQK